MALLTRILGYLRCLVQSKGMFVASVNSRDKLFHNTCSKCQFMESIFEDNKVYYKRKEEALSQGMRYCSVCSENEIQRTIGDFT